MDIYSDVSMISGASSAVSSASSRSTASSTVDPEASLLRSHRQNRNRHHRRQPNLHPRNAIVRTPEIVIDPVPQLPQLSQQQSLQQTDSTPVQQQKSVQQTSPAPVQQQQQKKETSECYKMTICSLTFVLFIVSLALIASVIILVYVLPNSSNKSVSSNQVGRSTLFPH